MHMHMHSVSFHSPLSNVLFCLPIKPGGTLQPVNVITSQSNRNRIAIDLLSAALPWRRLAMGFVRPKLLPKLLPACGSSCDAERTKYCDLLDQTLA